MKAYVKGMRMQPPGTHWVIFCTLFFLNACSQRSEPAPVERVYSGATVYDFTRGSLSGESYQVQRGDTLYSIAFRAEMDLRQIAQLNALHEPYQIFPGQVLRLSENSARNPVANPVTHPDGSNNRQISVKKRKETEINDLNRTVATNNQGEYVENEPVQKANNPLANVKNEEIVWQWPSQGRIVQRFSNDRPGANGLIFEGLKGDSVTAAAAGKVVYVGSALRGFGRLIILKHNDDYISAYAHNDELMVQEQQWVEVGQQIATMGDSGTDAVRLRFELRYRGSSVNPEQHLPRSR